MDIRQIQLSTRNTPPIRPAPQRPSRLRRLQARTRRLSQIRRLPHLAVNYSQAIPERVPASQALAETRADVDFPTARLASIHASRPSSLESVQWGPLKNDICSLRSSRLDHGQLQTNSPSHLSRRGKEPNYVATRRRHQSHLQQVLNAGACNIGGESNRSTYV